MALEQATRHIEQAVKDENHERVDQLNLVADALLGVILFVSPCWL